MGLLLLSTFNKTNVTGPPVISFSPAGSNIVRAILPFQDGSGMCYVGGNFTMVNGYAINRLARLNTDASVDTSFNIGTGFVGNVQTLAFAPDGSGKIYVGGNFTDFNGSLLNRIIRLNTDGSLDTGFSIGTGANNAVLAITAATDGSNDIYIGGNFIDYNGITRNRIARLNDDGSLDTGFAPTTGPSGPVNAICIAKDGSNDIYLSGSFSTYNGTGTHATRLIRVFPNGSHNTSFATGTGANNTVNTLITLNDGTFRVCGGGAFTVVSGTTIGRVGCVVPGGIGQGGFNSGTGANNTVFSTNELTTEASQVIWTGTFTAYNGTTRNRIIKVTTNTGVAGIDAAYMANAGTAFNALVEKSALDDLDRLYAVGSFTSFNGVAKDRLCRINTDGTLDTTFGA